MSERRITIYQRNTGRPIVLTDKTDNTSLNDLKTQLTQTLSGEDKIIRFQTIDDFLIIRSDEIGGIMLTAEGQFKELIPTPAQMVKDIVSENKKKKQQVQPQPVEVQHQETKVIQAEDKTGYEQILVIEDSSTQTTDSGLT